MSLHAATQEAAQTDVEFAPTTGGQMVEARSAAPPVAGNESAGLLAVVARAASDPRVDVEKFERLLAMQEKLETATERREFNAAIAAAKSEIGPVFKAKEVDYTYNGKRTNYRYEDFAGIARAVGPALAAQGLSYRFRSEQTSGRLRVTCVVSRGGYSEETSLESGLDAGSGKNDIQALGSAVTYLQRYTLKLALGLAASTDDDGRASSPSTAPALAPPAVTEDQIAELQSLIIEANDDPATIEAFKRDMLLYVNAPSIEAMKPDQIRKAISAIKAQIDDERKRKGKAA